ncbi:hypothetical protein VTN77DRAFT_6933 [Rasamsonia byssochlamydoides]|uniref:uncharacterized protein n=1 Tax=Rasamsonia byssochlamydoides TaxID=89139 RepID=UPI0037439FED
MDTTWPSAEDWNALNQSIQGVLIRTTPAASACYHGNPFDVPQACKEVKENWALASYQAQLPEGIDYPIYGNNSCLPPGATGYTEGKGCEIGGSPQYVVNATTEQQVATAMLWASQRNIRIVVKGTGHDLNGRYVSASPLVRTHCRFGHIISERLISITLALTWREWHSECTHCWQWKQLGFRLLCRAPSQQSPRWRRRSDCWPGRIYSGRRAWPLIQLAADQILKATVITTDGHRLVANEQQNKDLLWAIRGGGAGQYGVVTEYVLKAYPAPTNVVTGGLSVRASGNTNVSETATWNALASLARTIPDAMDTGLAGIMTAATGQSAMSFLSLNETVAGVAISLSFFGYNMTTTTMNNILISLAANVTAESDNRSLVITRSTPVVYPSFLSFFNSTNTSPSSAGEVSLISSRLLGREELSELPRNKLVSYLQQVLRGQNEKTGSLLLFGFQGGPGPANVPTNMRGSLNTTWRKAYVHALTTGASINATGIPSQSLAAAGEWMGYY